MYISAEAIRDIERKYGTPAEVNLSYEMTGREFDLVRKGQKLAKGNAIGLIPRSPNQIRMRNLLIRLLPYLPWRGLAAGGVEKAANAITLKDYQSRP